MDYKSLPFPIAYAVEPIFLNSKENSIPLGYIVSKAFLIREITNYTVNGAKKQFDVVYPVKGYRPNEDITSIRKPEFNQYGYCTNYDYTNYVYGTYEEAKKVRDKLNGALFLKYYPQYDMVDRMNTFQEYEYKIMEVTSILDEVKKVR